MATKKTTPSPGSKSSPLRRPKGRDVRKVQNVHHRDETLDRRYPYISLEKETAVILVANGATLEQAGRDLKVSHMTVSRWLRQEDVTEALEAERAAIHARIRQRFMGTIEDAQLVLANVLRKKKTGSASIPAGRLALQVLKETGYLPQAIDKDQEDRRRAELVDRFVKEMEEIIGE